MSSGKSAVCALGVIFTLCFILMLFLSISLTATRFSPVRFGLRIGRTLLADPTNKKQRLTAEQSCWVATSVFLVLMAVFWAVYDNVEW